MTARVTISLFLASLVFSAQALDTLAYGSDSRYDAAFIDTNGRLRVFPVSGGDFAMSLPVSFADLTYAGDGLSLYGFGPGREGPKGLARAELKSLRVTIVPNTNAFKMVSGFAISPKQDLIVISGSYKGPESPGCGIYEVKLPGGQVRRIAGNPYCEQEHSWVGLSLSPDARSLVAYRKPTLEVIDMESGHIRTIGEGFIGGAWSPDGKWLAVLEADGHNRTELLNSITMKRLRVFGTSNLAWSPDSRLLLAQRTEHCSPGWSSLVEIDVESGKETPIEGSHCKVNLNTAGWVSRDILQ
ncbi:MAG: hypothetical protein ABJA67_13780 [Chthonomonadales bacterium]